jgi:hypothetical protein
LEERDTPQGRESPRRLRRRDDRAANLAGELYELGGLYVMPDRLADYIEELGTVAAELNGGPPGFMLNAVKSARSDFLGTPPALRADANLEMSEIARIIAAREIERGLLG